MNIDKVINFPYPTPPSPEALQVTQTVQEFRVVAACEEKSFVVFRTCAPNCLLFFRQQKNFSLRSVL